MFGFARNRFLNSNNRRFSSLASPWCRPTCVSRRSEEHVLLTDAFCSKKKPQAGIVLLGACRKVLFAKQVGMVLPDFPKLSPNKSGSPLPLPKHDTALLEEMAINFGLSVVRTHFPDIRNLKLISDSQTGVAFFQKKIPKSTPSSDRYYNYYNKLHNSLLTWHNELTSADYFDQFHSESQKRKSLFLADLIARYGRERFLHLLADSAARESHVYDQAYSDLFREGRDNMLFVERSVQELAYEEWTADGGGFDRR